MPGESGAGGGEGGAGSGGGKGGGAAAQSAEEPMSHARPMGASEPSALQRRELSPPSALVFSSPVCARAR